MDLESYTSSCAYTAHAGLQYDTTPEWQQSGKKRKLRSNEVIVLDGVAVSVTSLEKRKEERMHFRQREQKLRTTVSNQFALFLNWKHKK